jgi:hypothetical protein
MKYLRLWGLLLSMLCAGCAGYGYKMNEALVGLDCRPAVVQEYGSCVAKKGPTK